MDKPPSFGTNIHLFPYGSYMYYIETHNEEDVRAMLQTLRDSISLKDQTDENTQRSLLALCDLEFLANQKFKKNTPSNLCCL